MKDEDDVTDYVIMTREQFTEMMVDLFDNFYNAGETPDEDEWEELILRHTSEKDVAVVELRYAWAGPALHILAASATMAANCSFDSDQATAIKVFAHYFHTKALEADNDRNEIPGDTE